MRVLLTTDTVGGVWVFTRELAAGLLATGHQVALVSFGRQPSTTHLSWAHAMRTAWHHSFQFHASDAPLEWMKENQRSNNGAELLLRTADVFQPDIVHSSQFCWGSLDLGIPRVLTAHSEVLSWADACRRDCLLDAPWLQRYRRLVQDGIDACTALAAPTRWMLDALAVHFALPECVEIIPNGRRLPALESDVVARKLTAITAGRLWDEAKNIKLLLQIRAPLPLLVAGEDTFDSSNFSHAKGLQPLGHLDEAALLFAFRSSSIYICPSTYEPFGLAPLEAALCGCAILANDLQSLREVWGDAALYFHKAAELTALLDDLVRSPEKLKAMQSRAGKRAAELTASRMTNSYLSLYLECLKPARQAAREFVVHAL